MHYFNQLEVELLAPAGNLKILNELIDTKADAFYFGGKQFNMRLHRHDFNFSHEELAQAIDLIHSRNKKAYITVNNLLTNQESEAIIEYLYYLESIKPDAIIVQDMAIIKLIHDLKINLELHASVMSNVNTLEMAKHLKSQGVSRVVIARELSLQTVKWMKASVDLEIEYFVHGDMCIAAGSQCFYSGILFGGSSNKGKCLKPCRWNYNNDYPFAIKDMYMYEAIPELIKAGVCSFKIEGRMRSSEYLINIINSYGDAIERYLENPFSFDRKVNSDLLYENRMRDFSTLFAFKDENIINTRYEGTGFFYSTGKVFSEPILEMDITNERINEINQALTPLNPQNKLELSVKVNNIEDALKLVDMEVDYIYLCGDIYQPHSFYQIEDLHHLCNHKQASKIVLGIPRFGDDEMLEEYHHFLMTHKFNLDGLLVGSMGALVKFKDCGLELISDYNVNIFNHKAFDFYKQLNLATMTISLETKLNNLVELVKKNNTEMIVYGYPTVMYVEHNLLKDRQINFYEDELKQTHPLIKDYWSRNHFLMSLPLNYLNLIPALKQTNLSRVRIEATYLNHELMVALVENCQQLIKNNNTPILYRRGTLGALNFN